MTSFFAHNRRIGFLFILCVFFLAGCSAFSSKVDKELQKMSAQMLFTKGEQSVQEGQWGHAIKYFNALQAQYPFSPYLKQSQIELIYAYYKDQDYPEAQATADRYLHLYPMSSDNDYVYYLRGLAYFDQDRNILQRYLNIDLSERDLESSEKAYQNFFTLVRRYPNSPYNQDARQRMIYLRDLLARHELHVAQFYMKRHAYVAAVNRASFLVQHYQGAPGVADGLAVLVKGYRQLQRYDDANKAYELLKHNYSHSKAFAKVDRQHRSS